MKRSAVILAAAVWVQACATTKPYSRADKAFLQAVAFENQGHINEAIAAYTKAIDAYLAIRPGSKDYGVVPASLTAAYSSRGHLYAVNRDFDKALADADAFIKLDPSNYVGYITRSARLQAKGDCAGAIAEVDRAYQVRPHQDVLEHRANLKAVCGQGEESLKDYEILISEVGVSNPKFYCQRGRILQAMRRGAAASKDYKTGCEAGIAECCDSLESLDAQPDSGMAPAPAVAASTAPAKTPPQKP